MSEDNKPKEYAFVYDLFSKEEIDEIVKIGNEINHEQGLVAASEKNPIRNSMVGWMHRFEQKNSEIYNKFNAVVEMLNTNFFNYDLNILETIQFSEYKVGEYYKCHKDTSKKEGYVRKITIVMQLTDPSEYDGGDLVLYADSIHKPERMPKERGVIIAFPSYILHEVESVTRGTRNSLVGWVNGNNFR